MSTLRAPVCCSQEPELQEVIASELVTAEKELLRLHWGSALLVKVRSLCCLLECWSALVLLRCNDVVLLCCGVIVLLCCSAVVCMWGRLSWFFCGLQSLLCCNLRRG